MINQVKNKTLITLNRLDPLYIIHQILLIFPKAIKNMTEFAASKTEGQTN